MITKFPYTYSRERSRTACGYRLNYRSERKILVNAKTALDRKFTFAAARDDP